MQHANVDGLGRNNVNALAGEFSNYSRYDPNFFLIFPRNMKSLSHATDAPLTMVLSGSV